MSQRVSKPATVSVIEDDADVRASLCALIAALGYPVRAFADAESFLAAGNTTRDAMAKQGVIVVDLQLPGMSGVELIQRLRDEDEALPLIAMSGEGPRQEALARHAGASAVLSKPLAADALSQYLDREFTR